MLRFLGVGDACGDGLCDLCATPAGDPDTGARGALALDDPDSFVLEEGDVLGPVCDLFHEADLVESRTRRAAALRHIQAMEGKARETHLEANRRKLCSVIKRDHVARFVGYCEVARKNLLAEAGLHQHLALIPLSAKPSEEDFDEVFQVVGIADHPAVESARWCVGRWVECRDDPEKRLFVERHLRALGVVGADMEAPDAKGTTALLHAVGENCVDGTEHCPVALLLAFGADACHRNDAHVTPLLAAAAKGHVKLFEILVLVLERQGRLDVAVERCTNGDGATVLHFLADRGHAQLLSFVLKRDAFQAVVDAKTKKTGETALVDAARHGRAPCVHALLDGGARPEAAALLAAAQHGHARVVEALLAAGASPAAKDGKGRTAADLCAADARRIASQNKTMLTMLGGMRKSFTSTATHASSADHDACLALLKAAQDTRHEKHHHAHKKDDHHHAHKKDDHHHVHAQKHH